MQYKLTKEFTKLTEVSGILYAMPDCSVEVATGNSIPAKDTGFVLHGGCLLPIAATDGIYARACGSHATLNVVTAKLPV